MDHQSVARILLALFCGLQGLSTALIDLSRTHATHPRWIGHARFHVVWQTSTVVVLSLIEIALILARGPLLDQRFYLAALLAAAPMAGFFCALVARGLYAGTLADPQGNQPLILKLGKTSLRTDLNLAAEIAGIVALAAIIATYRWN